MQLTVTSPNEKTKIDLEKVIREVENIPTIPESLIQILRVLDDSESGASDLARAVRLDAPLMSQILRLANSPYYSHQGNLSDINRCVAVLGYRTVRQMALGVSVATSLVSAVANTAGRLDYRELWRHSVVVGAMAKELAFMVGFHDPEQVFTAGLLHDIGKFILEIQFAERYDRLVEARSHVGCPLTEMEREEFGFDHADIGEAFGRIWYLPQVITRSLGSHHDEPTTQSNGDSPDRAMALVKLADYLANTMVPSRSDLGFDPRHVNPQALQVEAGIRIHELEENLSSLRDAVDLASDYLNLG
jgi:putative nucleotidyltransferase with HDIG domain